MVKTKDNMKLVPKMRFPGFEGEWKKKRLGDIGQIVSGLTYSPDDVVESGLLVLRSSNVKNRALVFTDNVYVNVDSFNPVQVNDILICVRNGSKRLIGKNALITEEVKGSAFGAFMTIFRGKSNPYAFHFFDTDSYRKNVHRNLGATINSINGKDLKKFIIHVPPYLLEQEKIASFLSAVDRKIEQLTCRKELLEQYKKGVMQKIFSQNIRFTNDNGKDYPDWQEKKLGDILTFISTNSFSRNDLNYENGKIKNIHYGDIHTTFKMRFDVAREKVPYVNETINLRKVTKEQFCQVGDVVIADASEDYNDVGKAIEIWNLEGEKLLAGLHTFLGRDVEGQTVNGFKGYLLQVSLVRKQIQVFAQGISVLGISKTNLAKVKFQLPCKKEQIKIVTILKSLDNKIESVQSQLTQTQTFKKGLLQQLFV